MGNGGGPWSRPVRPVYVVLVGLAAALRLACTYGVPGVVPGAGVPDSATTADAMAPVDSGSGSGTGSGSGSGSGTGDAGGPMCSDATAFQSQTTWEAGTYPDSVTTGDFNGDGKLDLAVANQSSNNVSVMLGKGNGTFQPPVNYPAGSPYDVITGDFNGDGKLDLLTAYYTYGVGLLLGNGDGTFQAQVRTVAQAGFANTVTVADFNGDGKLDIAVGGNGNFSVSVLLGNGNGTFQAEVIYATPKALPYAVTTGDFNGDGKLDLATGNDITNDVSVLLGNGDGTFRAAVNYPLGANPSPSWVTTGDFNGDGKLDLAAANQSFSGNVSVLLGNGDGTLQAAVDYAAGLPLAVTVGDFNGDGRPDVASANFASNNVSVLLSACQ